MQNQMVQQQWSHSRSLITI